MSTSASDLAGRLERRLEPLARKMLDTFVAEVPLYGHLPREQLDGEILDICRRNLRLFIEFVRAGDAPSTDALAAIRASAARRAEERVPLEAVLTAYHLGGRVGWEALQSEAGDGEHPALVSAAGAVMTFLQGVTAAVSAAYLEEQQAIVGEERDATRQLTEALLSGTATRSGATRVGVTIAPGYRVLTLAIGESADERDAGVEGAVASRRKVRRLLGELDRVAGREALAVLRADGGTVLVPVEAQPVEPLRAWADEVVARLVDTGGAPVCAGAAEGWGTDGVVQAGALAADVLELATKLPLHHGAWTLDDVVLEYALTRRSPATERLRAVLAPLALGPDLLITLQGWFDADFDRRRAAAGLHVHPNTLDYRLKRISEITKLDVSTARGIQLLGAALAVHRLLPDD